MKLSAQMPPKLMSFLLARRLGCLVDLGQTSGLESRDNVLIANTAS